MSDIALEHIWVVVELSGQKYAIPVDVVRELVSVRDRALVSLPQSGPDVVGVLTLRDKTITVIDLRLRLGMSSMDQETDAYIETLNEREHDHIVWLKELEASAKEDRAFKLATDPHACKFGRWFDALMADERALTRITNGDLGLRKILDDFDHPHQRIHGIAHRVTALVRDHHHDQALAVIEETRNGALAEMIKLFELARGLIRDLRRPLIAVVEHHGRTWGLQVDAVENVTTLDAGSISQPPAMTSDLVDGFHRDEQASTITTLLNIDVLLAHSGCPAAVA